MGTSLPFDVVTLSLGRKAQEAMLGVHFLARLGLIALLAIDGMTLCRTIVLASEVLLDVGRDLVKGAVKLAEKASAAGRGLLGTLENDQRECG